MSSGITNLSFLDGDIFATPTGEKITALQALQIQERTAHLLYLTMPILEQLH
jgi:hypothetical protein